MKAVLISDDGSQHKVISLNYGLHFIIPLLLIVAIFLLLRSYFFVGSSKAEPPHNTGSDLSLMSDKYLTELGKLRSEVDRLNALGSYLAKQKNINIDKFMLQAEPALGGVSFQSRYKREPETIVSFNKSLSNDIDQLEQNIANQEHRYYEKKETSEFKRLENEAFELYANNRNKIELISDFTLPVVNGYTSSYYGPRRDPINGKYRNHRGIDVAAPRGTKIQAIASGFVSFIGKKGGYGNVLEIMHSDSLKSRYAHLHSYNVKLGQVVHKGDKVAEVGSTGRVTGPHLHLEVWKNNKTVDPMSYLKDLNYIER